ncbi:lysophospholipase [Frankia casuarinae]|uniref:Alpha/beta hydrolase fold n=2 Tax=Frankia casuarinae (strain DSM 45818 / CECT 9043 / HFP020203 / CcI3) TaxID=106370 RepID=Q2JEH9_FRACC|nr:MULTISPECIES: alpha/beta fold hydrolase [Frankia]ABD10313.1 alpha/beta hydrolase fold [Frankia casuarinae]ETA01929.1 lysophospholipase [Frankia sp. CcI6]EYT92624.1 lysophospholipase [Frankia casuarinae]KDA43371.1 lysophospholipase [Frankia sp. BMG5.23]KEZ38344.1 lysophospholipase [Frankia sp. CeD]
MAEIIANGIRLHVQRLAPRGGASTDSPVVVMVHGMVMDNISSFYFTLGNCLADAGCDVICYDLRGHGRSERTRGGYELADSMADLLGLLDELGVDRPVHLVGNSYGATMALAFGLEFTSRVASLTLIEPPFLIEGLGEEMARSLTQILVAMTDEEVQEWLDNGAGRVASRATRAAQRLLQETTIATDMLATPPFSTEALAALNVPVLAVYGENSDIIGQAAGLAALVPECTLIVLEHHTHMVLREAAHYLRDLLRWWLFRRQTPPPPYVRANGRRFATPDWVTQRVPPPDLNAERRPAPISADAAVAAGEGREGRGA